MKNTSKGGGAPRPGAAANPSTSIPTSAPAAFTLSVRGLHDHARNASDVSGTSVEEAVLAVLALDVSSMVEPVITWCDQLALVALDIDRADDALPLTDDEIPGLFPDWLPKPVTAWSTHDGGLRARDLGFEPLKVHMPYESSASGGSQGDDQGDLLHAMYLGRAQPRARFRKSPEGAKPVSNRSAAACAWGGSVTALVNRISFQYVTGVVILRSRSSQLLC